MLDICLSYIRDILEISLYMHEIFLRYARDMFMWSIRYSWEMYEKCHQLEICLSYVVHMHGIWLRCAWNMPEIYLTYAWDMHEICQRYAWAMGKIYVSYIWGMPEIGLIYEWDMPEFCLRYRVSQKKWGDVLHLISQLPEWLE